LGKATRDKLDATEFVRNSIFGVGSEFKLKVVKEFDEPQIPLWIDRTGHIKVIFSFVKVTRGPLFVCHGAHIRYFATTLFAGD